MALRIVELLECGRSRNLVCGVLRQTRILMTIISSKRSALEAELRQALQRQQLRLHYQTQVDAEGHVIGVVALLHFQHPQRGLVPPVVLIPKRARQWRRKQNSLVIPYFLWYKCAKVING